MPTPENINPLLDGVAGNISQEAQDAYARLLLLIEGGTDPAEAVRIVQAGFNGAYVASLQKAFGAILGQAVEAGFVTGLPVSGVPLSARLYRNTLQTSMEVAGLVKSHAAGIHDARELAIRLYDGYNPKDGIQRPIEKQSLAELPRPLRELMKADIKLKGSYEQLLEQVQTAASRLKTQALRAAYSEAIDAWAKGKGGESLKRKLDVAYREKTRYHANRIAQTELARAHADKVASEFMHDDTISVVKVIMSPAHPMRDICNLFAEADLYGLGKGCYPKGKAPKPIFHPFCRCVLSSRPNLDAADAREVPGCVKDFLNGLPKGQAAQMVGSEARLFEVVKGGKSIDEVLNAGKDKAYHLKRLNQVDLSVVHPARIPLTGGVKVDNPAMKKDFPTIAPPWETDFPQVAIHTTISSLKKTGLQPGEQLDSEGRSPMYNAGKHGDAIAARKVAQHVLKVEKVIELQSKYPNATLVPVHEVELLGKNKLPRALADVMSDVGGWPVDTEIVQVMKVTHTGATATKRLTQVPIFDGAVKAGQEYIIVDDVTTSGSTLSALRHFISARGGKVVHATSFATTSNRQTGYGGYLAPFQKTLDLVQKKFDTTALNALLSDHGIATTYAHLTNSQAKYILSFKDIKSFERSLSSSD